MQQYRNSSMLGDDVLNILTPEQYEVTKRYEKQYQSNHGESYNGENG